MGRRLTTLLLSFLMVLAGAGVCLAGGEPSPSILTVEQAIDLALKNSHTVRTADLALEAANIADDQAWESVGSALLPDANGQYHGPVDSWNAIYAADYNLETARRNYDTTVDSVRFKVYQKYYAVVEALDTADAQRLSSQQAAERYRIAQLRLDLGLDTRLDLYQAQQKDVSAQSSLAGSSESLEQKYKALMEYIGWAKNERPLLVRELAYTPLKLADAETRIADIVRDSPGVWLARRSLLLTQQTSGSSGDYYGLLTDINVEKADLAVITTRDAMTEATRNIYYGILGMEEAYDSAAAGAKAADEALRVAKLLYEVGMGTKLDVTAAEIAAQSARQAVDNLSYQHAMLVMAFEKPWVYGSV